jgi:hypothetical protein
MRCIIFREEQAMKTIFSVIFLLMAQSAKAYETGAMTCEDIGKFAAALMADREKGQKKEAALETVNQQEWQGEVEKSNMIAVVGLIHGHVGDQLADAKAAYSVIRRDCEVSKAKQQR